MKIKRKMLIKGLLNFYLASIPIQEDQTDIAVSIDSSALNCLLLQASIGGGSRSPFTSKENLPHAVHP